MQHVEDRLLLVGAQTRRLPPGRRRALRRRADAVPPVFNFVRAAVSQFIAQGDGGRVIVIGSPAGQRASFGQAPYSAVKADIVGMARTWAAEQTGT